MQRRLFCSALAEIFDEVSSQKFKEKFSDAERGTKKEDYGRLHEMFLDAQVYLVAACSPFSLSPSPLNFLTGRRLSEPPCTAKHHRKK
jgi:hypothetical protein